MANQFHGRPSILYAQVAPVTNTLTDLMVATTTRKNVDRVVVCNLDAGEITATLELSPLGVAHHNKHVIDSRKIAAGDSAEIPLDLMLNPTDKLRVKIVGVGSASAFGPK